MKALCPVETPAREHQESTSSQSTVTERQEVVFRRVRRSLVDPVGNVVHRMPLEPLARSDGSESIAAINECALRYPQQKLGYTAPLLTRRRIAVERSHDTNSRLKLKQKTERPKVRVVDVRDLGLASQKEMQATKQEVRGGARVLTTQRRDIYVSDMRLARREPGPLSEQVNRVRVS